MELFHAHRQWATRPADQRFTSLEQMYQTTKAYAAQAAEAVAPWGQLRVEQDGADLALVGPSGQPARLTNFAFKQLCKRVQAPANYLATLPVENAVADLNVGMIGHAADTDADAKLLFHTNGGLVCRAATTEVYERYWNYELIERLMDTCSRFNLEAAHQTFSWDGGADHLTNAERALYASDHDMFAMLMTRERAIEVGKQSPLYRGLICFNSEVGDCSLGLMSFYFRDVCGNFIIWGAEDVVEVRLVHRKSIRAKWGEAIATVKRYLNHSGEQDERKIASSMTTLIGGTKDEVLDRLFGVRTLGQHVSRKVLAASYDAVVEDEDGDPKTVWGMAQGMTRHSQTLPYADDRIELDRAAGKLLTITF